MQRVLDRLERVQRYINFVLIALLVLFVSLQILVRLLLKIPLFLWTEELSRYLLVWLVFLGIGLGVKNDRHFAMDLVLSLLGPRCRLALRIFNDLCMGVILVMLIMAGLRFTHFGLFQYGLTLPISMVSVYIAIPLGAVLALLYLVDRTRRRIGEGEVRQ